ncbi:MAG TPA: hypothetical protein PLU73_10545 [Bacteroidia bacterium]|jgi:hypothetical protein|nr:hypothetical protein [Bacteroidia bacterium]
MKKLALAFTTIVLLAACAKDRNCTCTQTSTYNGGTPVTTSQTWILVETTKAQAKANCTKMEKTSTTGTNVSVSTADCKLD